MEFVLSRGRDFGDSKGIWTLGAGFFRLSQIEDQASPGRPYLPGMACVGLQQNVVRITLYPGSVKSLMTSAFKWFCAIGLGACFFHASGADNRGATRF